MQNQYPEAASNFERDIQNALGINLQHKYAQLYRCMGEKKKEIINEARSFRGSSQLDCGIYDATNPDEPEKERFKTYNLPSLLSNFTFEWWEKKDFLDRARKAGVATNRYQEALCCLKLTGYRDVRENWQFYHAGEIGEIAKSGKVQILKGLEVTTGINSISKKLSSRGLVCFVCDRDRASVRATLGLPIHFQVYALSNELNDTNPRYSIAFGQSALLLETLAWHWKPKEDEGWIC